MNATAVGTAVAVVAANLVLYTAYDKARRRLVVGQLWEVLLVRHSVDKTLVELNKVAALTGLTLLALAFIPALESMTGSQASLLTLATLLLMAHSAYSTYKYYGEPTRVAALSTWPQLATEIMSRNAKQRLIGVRRLSVLFGVAAQAVLVALSLASLPRTAAAGVIVVVLGTLHFYSMEIDHRFRLGVRPFGWLPMGTSLLLFYLSWRGRT